MMARKCVSNLTTENHTDNNKQAYVAHDLSSPECQSETASFDDSVCCQKG